ncbi:hypothetical protein [Nocardioides sp.]|uniref:hypothetical protein n=1 Tax=Nocardioides sp. TaxID=35761 RepID=UPI002C27BA13|nr:hypothetical protein [Nocardioides sp.]HXH79056.1 hypothetical protein [Nocardioides sp.]
MRFSRIITGLTAAGLLGLTPLAVSAPANADGQTYTSNIAFEISPAQSLYSYGDDFYVSGSVTGPTAVDTPTGGQAQLQMLTPANPVWTTIAVDDSPGFLYFTGDFKFLSNTQLKVVYTGYTATSQFDDSYLAGESAPLVVPVTYVLNAKTPGTSIVGKIKPSYKKKKVIIQRKVGKTYKKYRTVRTNNKSAFRVKLPTGKRGKKVFFRVIVKGSSEMTGLAAGFYTIRY